MDYVVILHLFVKIAKIEAILYQFFAHILAVCH